MAVLFIHDKPINEDLTYRRTKVFLKVDNNESGFEGFIARHDWFLSQRAIENTRMYFTDTGASEWSSQE
jgi:hypothetical protein